MQMSFDMIITHLARIVQRLDGTLALYHQY